MGWAENGLSPRLRGTRDGLHADAPCDRFIPAPAGNTPALSCKCFFLSVYPRACGEHPARAAMCLFICGLSPLLRGTLIAGPGNSDWPRFIPAPAGNTIMSCARLVAGPVYPRACGEHSENNCFSKINIGLSPRLRGTLRPQLWRFRSDRFIPAPAGNTSQGPVRAKTVPVYPRACGEHEAGICQRVESGGLSPRLRGTR